MKYWGDEDCIEPSMHELARGTTGDGHDALPAATFAVLHPDGELTDVRRIPVWALKRCFHLILRADHYGPAPDFECRCTDPDDEDMPAWGYAWISGKGR